MAFITSTVFAVAVVAATLYLQRKYRYKFADKDVLDARLEALKNAYELRDEKLGDKCLKAQQQINQLSLEKAIYAREALSCKVKAKKIADL